MARRRRTSLIDELVDIASKLPWWLGLVLAAVFYFLLSNYAAKSNPAIDADMGNSAAFVGATLLHTLANFGQYLLPGIFLIGAIVSLINQIKRKSLFRNAVNSESASAVREMGWREFEMLVGELFRRRGYAVAEKNGIGADGGIDLKLRKGTEIFLVQCKHWRAYKVSVNIVRELYGVMAAEGAAGGFVVTSGVFTSDSKAFASDKNVELIDGAHLGALLQEAHTGNTAGMWQANPDIEGVRHGTKAQPPICPQCGGAMVRRTARRGQNAGLEFWGCSGYPGCRGVVNG